MNMTAVRFLVFLVACCLSAASSAARLPRQPTGPEEFTFPEPKIENVYQAWKPIDYGHPLVDATIHYAPPELERVQLGSGFPVPTRPAQQGNSRNLVFEASRPKNEGLTDHRLQATVYHGKGLVPRDTVVTIPSQRRNDVIQQDPRHGRNQVIRKLPPLKSGIFYVDDPHEEFRAKPAPQEPSVDRYHGDRNTDDETSGFQKSEERVHYVPVSLLSTPPTIQPPQKPYGDIVNKDFNELFKKKQRPLGTKRHRSQHRGKISAGKSTRNSVYPLGNPYYRTPSTQYGPSRLEGVLGPPNPQLDHRPSHAFDSRSSSSWLPAESYNVHASGREIDYRQEPVIFHVRDSGELYQQQAYPQSETGWDLDAEGSDSSARLEPEVRRDGGSRYDPHYAQPTQRPYQGTRVRSAPLEMEEMGYSATQLYQLCTQEVPEYLQHHLCKAPSGHFPNDSGFSERSDVNIGHNQVESPHAQHQTGSHHSLRNRTGPSFYDELTREEDENGVEATSLRSVSVRLPPKPQFQFVQDNQYVASNVTAMLQERSLPEVDDNPYQLIYQTAPQHGYSDSDEPPFPYEEGATQGGPAPIVYSLAQSKVVVYRPNELTTTTPEPTTTSTTTTTTSPLPTSSTTTARPFFYQAPETQPPVPALSRRPNPTRQVLFNKRREGGGGVSRPFEYLSRLSSFLSGRVLPGRGVRPRPRPERPQLITRRTGGRR